ncbi:MAG: esterase family protein [Chloroflexi bacterium]|nr:esterase family protein [Chloroflexota bacterium]
MHEFDRLVAQVTAAVAADQQPLVEMFIAANTVSPLINDERAIIFYTGAAESVVLRGDMLGEQSRPLTRLGQTTLWFYEDRYEPDARLDYHLLVDGEDVGDPRNPCQVPSGYGPRAEVRMRQYGDPGEWLPRSGAASGTIESFADFSSTCYPSTRTVWIYTPAGYDPSRRYPSVYFHDGGDYLNFASAQTIFDNLIAAGDIPPCIAVFIDPSHEHGRRADYDLNRDYCRFVAEELVPWVDSRYATQRSASQRAIIGASFGGLISLFAAQLYPAIFGLVASQSGFVGRRDAAVMQLYTQPAPLAVHLIVGTYETEIGPDRYKPLESDFLQANRQLRDILAAQGYRHAYAEYHEGHSWGLWRARLGDALLFLLNP